ncbi:hypothetical protein [Nonomuraea jiangxiensis]|uniref:Putative thiazole-containing bacteriocin maturation protein n=1 Tax=Nonomuraea jiangxiensis TaxID=633440 RepID=A0A1G8RZ86_9ACTN|nr:hypothetical protein [Nonomuraea jiangxiensis]SDJ22277.1 putative thiazole-containing bacteriocin maturation protein [Nonomuraea jiangxiensis]
MSVDRMRPRLKASAFYVPVEGGVHFQSGNRSVLTLRGSSLHAWLDRITPLLDGTHLLSELTAGLGEERRAMVVDLVSVLHRHGLVKDLATDRPHGLTAAEMATYAAEIAFVDEFQDSAEHRFERYRTSRAVLVGAGLTMESLVHSCLHSGLRDVRAFISPEVPTDLGLLDEYARRGRDRDPAQTLTVEPLPGSGPAALRAVASAADVVLHVSDLPSPERAAQLDAACGASGADLVHAVVTGDEAWIGPVFRYGEAHTRWAAVWNRLTTRPLPGTGPSRYLGGPTASLVANHLVFMCFRDRTGVAEPGPAVRLDLETLRTTSHRVVPYAPVASSGKSVEARLRELDEGPEVGDEEFAARVTALIDDRLGVLDLVTEGGLEQLPLRVSKAVVTVPGDAAPIEVYGAALDLTTARCRAARDALARYAAAPGHVGAGNDNAPSGRPPQGVRLADGHVVEVTAPASIVAAGATWAGAVEQALLTACGDLAAELAADPAGESSPSAGRRFPAVALRDELLDQQARRYHELLLAGGERCHIYDLGELLDLPLYAFGLGDRVVHYRAGVTSADAIRDGLECLLLDLQARLTGLPELGRPARTDLPARMRGAEPDDAPAAKDLLGEPAERRQVIAARLADHGRHLAVEPLHADPAVTRVLPYLAGLVPCDGAAR